MKISVITPVLNGERYIRETVQSVLSQEGDFELEYIVCDGRSADGTLAILKEYETDPRFYLYSRQDGSPQEAINAGMAKASGDIGGWLNSDDLYEPGALQSVVQALAMRPDCDWTYGRCRIIDAKGLEIRKPVTFYKNLLGIVYSRNILLTENYINQPATFWKMSLWREIQPLNPAYKAAWDYELWLKMAQHSPAIPIRKFLSRFRRHPGSISENHFRIQFDEELAISRSYGNGFHNALHKFNKWKITTVYRLLS